MRADARRNIDALLDAGMRVLAEQPGAGLTHVAKAAGVTRTTLYAHFSSREALEEAIVERAFAETVAALDAAQTEEGDPAEALVRLLDASWSTLERHLGLIATIRVGLGADRLRHHHQGIGARIERLVERGQRAGAFRDDLPASWLVATYFGVVHAASDEVEAGALDAERARAYLAPTLLAAFRPPASPPGALG